MGVDGGDRFRRQIGQKLDLAGLAGGHMPAVLDHQRSLARAADAVAVPENARQIEGIGSRDDEPLPVPLIELL